MPYDQINVRIPSKTNAFNPLQLPSPKLAALHQHIQTELTQSSFSQKVMFLLLAQP